MSYKRNITRYSRKKNGRKLNVKKFKAFISKYREYPDKFAEDFYDVKLYCYQKLPLRMMNKLERRKYEKTSNKALE